MFQPVALETFLEEVDFEQLVTVKPPAITVHESTILINLFFINLGLEFNLLI
jgi:hypothetical protein